LWCGHADVTALLDATTKNIRSQYKYDEFGNITSETYYDSNGVETTDENEIIKSQILYAGYQYDEESKYYNLHARYYDPQTARFLQQDTYRGTIADPLSLNLYTYCHNEPMMYYDPTGHELTKWDKAHLSKDEQKKILECSQKWTEADRMWKIVKFPAAKAALESLKKDAHDEAEEIRNKYRTEREYGDDNGYTTYVTENGIVYKDSPPSYYYIKNYLSNSASEGTGKVNVENEDVSGLGKAVKSKNDFNNLSTVDLLARTLYGECTSGNDDYGMEAVAWTILNRLKSGGWTWYCDIDYVNQRVYNVDSSRPNSLRDIVLTPFQYAALTGEWSQPNGHPTALNQNGQINLQSKAWKKAVDLATKMVNNPDSITKPDAFKNYNYNSFLSEDQFKITSDANGNQKITLYGKVINDSVNVMGNRFFVQ